MIGFSARNAKHFAHFSIYLSNFPFQHLRSKSESGLVSVFVNGSRKKLCFLYGLLEIKFCSIVSLFLFTFSINLLDRSQATASNGFRDAYSQMVLSRFLFFALKCCV